MIGSKRNPITTLGTWDISPTEQLHIAIGSNRNAPAVDVRLHTLLSTVTGIYIATPRGVTLNVEALEWLILRLDEAHGQLIASRTPCR